jgi:uncharacterized protein YegL
LSIGLKSKGKKTHVVLIVDRSGSMQPHAKEYMEMYNAQVWDHQGYGESGEGGEVFGTLVLFNEHVETPFTAQPIADLAPITVPEYAPTGGTAMYDAIGQTLQRLRKLDKAGENVSFLVIILSDGEENASRQWTGQKIKSLIHELKATDHWTFQYIGCSEGALKDSKVIGLNTFKFQDTKKGIHDLSAAMACSNTAFYSSRGMGLTSVSNYMQPTEEPDAK